MKKLVPILPSKNIPESLEFYQRVFVMDIQFRDVGERLAAVEGASS